MKIYQIVLVGMLASVNLCYSQNYTREDVYRAWGEENVHKLVSIHSKNAGLRGLTEEAIMSMKIGRLDLSFEDLEAIEGLLVGDEPLHGLFSTLFQEKKAEILKTVTNYTPKQLEDYMVKNPLQRKFIESEMRKAINNSLTSLPLDELYYVDRQMPYIDSLKVRAEANGRSDERRDILSGKLNEYIEKERTELSYLLFLMKIRSYEYFCRRFRNICTSYACIGQIPPDIYGMTYQYRSIINRNLKSTEIQKYLQTEADAICAVINLSREKYCAAMGKNEYVKMSIRIPVQSYKKSIPETSLYKVTQAYEDYDSSRQTISTIGGVAKFLGAGLWASLGESVAEVMVGDGLTDKITSARLEYVGDSYKVLEKETVQQINSTQDIILRQIYANQEKFIKDAK